MSVADSDVRDDDGRAQSLVVVAAIIQAGHLLAVSKKDAPEVFCLPGGKTRGWREASPPPNTCTR